MQKNRKEEYLKAKELEAERNSKQEKITELLLSMKEKEERQKKVIGFELNSFTTFNEHSCPIQCC